MSLDKMREEYDRLGDILYVAHWKRIVVMDSKNLSRNFVPLLVCPICSATVYDRDDHIEWHLRCLQ